MKWVFLSLLTALAVASQDAWVKKQFSRFSTYEMSAFPLIYSLPLFLISLAFIPVPALDFTFWWSFIVGLPLNGLAFVLYMRAIQISPLSLTLPYLAFTPTFIIATGFIFLGEMPSLWGISGILATALGSYVLHLDTEKRDFLAPLKAVTAETGSWLMLIVAFLFSFTAVLGKLSILHSSPVFFGFFFFAGFDLFLLVVFGVMGKIRMKTFKPKWTKGLVAGLLFYAHVFFHSHAIALVQAAYMISIKRLSILIGVVYGGLFFKEKQMLVRLLGSALMVSGAILIVLKGK